MSILSLDYIVAYIMNKELPNNTKHIKFPLNIGESDDLINDEYNNILNGYKRYGIINKCNKYSLYKSILYLLDDKFKLLSEDDMLMYTINLITELKSLLLKDDRDIKKAIKVISEMDNIILKYISGYFDINIILLNRDGLIEIITKDEEMNIFKYSIILMRINNEYEPVMEKDGKINNKNKELNKILDYNNIIMNGQNLRYSSNVDKIFGQKINILDEIIEEENDDDYREIIDIKESNELNIKLEDVELSDILNEDILIDDTLNKKSISYSKTELKKKKKNELVDIMISKGLNKLDAEKNTRDKLIELILKK